MSLLAGFRLSTLLTRILLAVVFVFIAGQTRSHGPKMRAWSVLSVSAVMYAVTTLLVEVLYWGIIGDKHWIGTDRMRHASYNLAYIANVTTSAIVPLLLVIVLTAGRWIPRIAGFSAILLLMYAAASVVGGADYQWERLMDTVRILDFIALTGNLVVWSLVVLRRAEIDIYLAGLLVVETVFLVVVPIQEVFFQAAGRAGSTDLWQFHQVLQFAMCAAQLAIVLTVLRLVTRGSILPRLRLGGVL